MDYLSKIFIQQIHNLKIVFSTVQNSATLKSNKKSSYIYYKIAHYLLQVVCIDSTIIAATFVHSADVEPYDENKDMSLTDIMITGTDFQYKVWQAVAQIPLGKTSSYKDIAQSIEHPTAWRAVANAVANNKVAYFIPCHRVVCNNRKLGGYRWGVETKIALLQMEERVGFEPTIPISRDNGFQDRRFRPLSHLSQK